MHSTISYLLPLSLHPLTLKMGQKSTVSYVKPSVITFKFHSVYSLVKGHWILSKAVLPSKVLYLYDSVLVALAFQTILLLFS